MTAKQMIILAGIVILGITVFYFISKGVSFEKKSGDGWWLCQEGKWVKYGETNERKPVTPCN